MTSMTAGLGVDVLSVYFGDLPEAIYNTATYFKNSYRSSWITDPYAVSIIKDVIESPMLGSISPLQLSGGVKTLLLMKFDRKHIFNASTCGDNCAKWILDMAKDRKLVVNLYHVMDFGREDFKIKVVNSNRIAHNMDELIHESIPYL